MAQISASVGHGGVNRKADVLTVQTLINLNIGQLVPLKMVQMGACGPDTIAAIRDFQRRVLKMANPDGRVDPNGKTLAKLSEAAPVAAVVVSGVEIAEPAKRVLVDILKAAGLTSAKVTSGVRTAADQARVMYENIASKGVDFNYKLYGVNGDKVVKVYADNPGKPKDAVIALMQAKIVELGPSKVSKHCSDTHYVFDVAPSSIKDHGKFVAAAEAHQAVSKLLKPPTDPAFHLEIPKTSPHL